MFHPQEALRKSGLPGTRTYAELIYRKRVRTAKWRRIENVL